MKAGLLRLGRAALQAILGGRLSRRQKREGRVGALIARSARPAFLALLIVCGPASLSLLSITGCEIAVPHIDLLLPGTSGNDLAEHVEDEAACLLTGNVPDPDDAPPAVPVSGHHVSAVSIEPHAVPLTFGMSLLLLVPARAIVDQVQYSSALRPWWAVRSPSIAVHPVILPVDPPPRSV